MINATGTTQYNMLKDAERRGHKVVVEGDRYWLIPAGESFRIGQRTSDASVVLRQPDSDSSVTADNSATFSNPRVPGAGHRQPAEPTEQSMSEGAYIPIVPAVASIIGWHGDESPDGIVARKAADIAKVGHTLWVFQSRKVNTKAVQAFGRDFGGAAVYFIEGNAFPARRANAAIEMSMDGRNWAKLPNEIGPVTGKLSGCTALILDQLVTCTGALIDMWRFAEHPGKIPVRFARGASTACIVPAAFAVEGMKSRYRRIVAMGRLAAPYAVYVR